MAVDRPLPVEKSFRGSSVRGRGSRRLYRKGQPVAASESWASAIARKKKEATRKGRLVFLKKPINQKKRSPWRFPRRFAGGAVGAFSGENLQSQLLRQRSKESGQLCSAKVATGEQLATGLSDCEPTLFEKFDAVKFGVF